MGTYASRHSNFIMTDKTFNTSKYDIEIIPATMVHFLGLKTIGGISYRQTENGVDIKEGP